MATLTLARAGAADQLRTVGGLRVHTRAPGVIVPPAALVVPADGAFLTFDSTMDGDSDDLELIVLLLVSKAKDEKGQERLDAYLAPIGEKSVRAAINAFEPADGIHYMRATEARNYGVVEYNSVEYLGCELAVSVSLGLTAPDVVPDPEPEPPAPGMVRIEDHAAGGFLVPQAWATPPAPITGGKQSVAQRLRQSALLLRDRLEDEHLQVQVGLLLTDTPAFDHLAGMPVSETDPRLWDDVRGATINGFPATSVIGLAQNAPVRTPSHEFGHAVDILYLGTGVRLSIDSELVAFHQDEIFGNTQINSYYRTGPNNTMASGRQEWFATSYASWAIPDQIYGRTANGPVENVDWVWAWFDEHITEGNGG